MHKYRVIERGADPSRWVLEGGVGRYHLARVLNDPPRIGDFLTGSRPHLGFGLLLSLRVPLAHRVIFETINSADPGFNSGWAALPWSPSRKGSLGDR